MSAPNEDLRDYVTRVGFQLTLTRPQIIYLVVIDMNKDITRVMNGFPHFIQCGRALQRRGLINHCPDQRSGFKLTEAGQLTVGLLKESGIYQDVISPREILPQVAS